MIMLAIYLILLISIGINFIILLNKLSLFQIKNLLKIEVVSIVLTSGIIIFTLYMYLIGLIGIKYERYIFIPIVAGLIFNIVYGIYYFIKNKSKKQEKEKIETSKLRKAVTAILLCANIVYIVYFIGVAVSNKLVFIDEFSVWALNAKNIFIGKKMDFFINTGLENYPNGLPLLYSGFYVLIDGIKENFIRIFSGIFLIINLLNIMGLCKKRKANINVALLLILIVYEYCYNFGCYASSTYGDVPFMVLYTCGILYFIEWIIYDRKIENMIISMVNTIGACWCKQDGTFLVAYNIFVLIIIAIFYKKLNIEKLKAKSVIIYIITILIVPISWKIYNNLAHFPTELLFGAGSKVEMHLEYFLSLMQNITIQFYKDNAVVLLMGIISGSMFITYYKLDKKDKLYVVIALGAILVNIAFLILCYIFVFGGEAIFAASFIRYYTRVIMIQVVTSTVLLKPIFLKEKVEENKGN